MTDALEHRADVVLQRIREAYRLEMPSRNVRETLDECERFAHFVRGMAAQD